MTTRASSLFTQQRALQCRIARCTTLLTIIRSMDMWAAPPSHVTPQPARVLAWLTCYEAARDPLFLAQSGASEELDRCTRLGKW